ncbi:MAG: hypothetical protein ACTHJ9_05290 [Rhodanobacter sp.]
MGKSFGLQMAKASPEDIARFLELAAMLSAIDGGEYPCYFATPEERDAAEEAGNIPAWFDADNIDHLRHLHELLTDMLNRLPGGALWRVGMGMDTILRNDILDPDADHLAMHPKFEAAARDRQKLRDALAALVGSSNVDELHGMEVAMRELAAPDEDKAVTINAIRALIATAPEAEAGRTEAEQPECEACHATFPLHAMMVCRTCWEKLSAESADSARLDWLERHPRLAEIVIDGHSTDCYVYAVSGAQGVKLREIIDATMQASTAKEANHG